MVARTARLRPPWRSIQKYMRNRIALFTVTIGLSLAALVRADDNVREVQTKLSDEGFYFGEIDGAYSSDLSAALSRYQIRNGLPITGQLDVETSKALGAKPAVGPSTAATGQSSETWRRLRKGERRTSTKAQETSSPSADEEAGTSIETPRRSAAAARAPTSSETTEPASAPAATAPTSSETRKPASSTPATALDTGSPAPEFSTERLRDYVAAFVLAGLDKNVGAETEFFADRVEYYDQGIMDREKIREDLKRYDERWPERHFWIAGAINVEPQSENRVRVTFPLGFKLRNGNRTVTGKVNKSLVLEAAGDDLQIVAVNESKG
jgi:peptidoglycan hydrolase-like protein with peptidoglycan-binding domain